MTSINPPVGAPVKNWQTCPLPSSATMEGRYCSLERLNVERHAASLYAANQGDAEGANWTYLPYGPFYTFVDYRKWLESVSTTDDPMFFAIVDRASGEANGDAIGLASYLRLDPGNGAIEVGHLNFSPRLQRTPAATEAMYLMMAQVFALGYRRYEWKCNALNAPSRAAAQRLGFSFEGVFRQAAVVKGNNRDTAWYAMIDSEWPALRAAFEQWLSPDNFDAQGQQRTALKRLTEGLLYCRG